MSHTISYYEVLGISKDDSLEKVKKAYKRLAIIWHPDKNQTNREEAEEKFKRIAEAYSILSDPKKRRNYDLYGDAEFNGGVNLDFAGRPGFLGSFGDFTYERAEAIFRDFFKNDGADFMKAKSKMDDKQFGVSIFEEDSQRRKDPFSSSFFSSHSSKYIDDAYKGKGSYRSYTYTIPSKPEAPNSKNVTTSTIIRNGKKIVVTQTTHINSDGTKRTEVHEKVEHGGKHVHENRYVNHHGTAQLESDAGPERRN